MSDPSESLANGHPLSGVLDRLLARERGAAVPLQRPPREQPPAVGNAQSRPVPNPALRRMLVIAGLGADEGDETRRALARWGLRQGRRPAALDIGCTARGSASAGDPRAPEWTSIPLLSLPSAPERLRDEPAEVLSALLEQLRRHESAADLLLVRVSPRFRMALMRAAFLAGGLIVPVANSYDTLYEAFQLARQALESFLDLALWPHSSDPAAVNRFRAMVREVLARELDPLEEAQAGALDRLAAPPEAGFLVSLVDSDTPSPPAELLQVGSLTL